VSARVSPFTGAIVLPSPGSGSPTSRLLCAAELNAEIEREHELAEGVPRARDAQPACERR
jgi:hypothetical protein